jgi:hypothetical protein
MPLLLTAGASFATANACTMATTAGVLTPSSATTFIFVATDSELLINNIVGSESRGNSVKMSRASVSKCSMNDLRTSNFGKVCKSGYNTKVTEATHVSTLVVYKYFNPRLPLTHSHSLPHTHSHSLTHSSTEFQNFPQINEAHYILVHGIEFARPGDSGGLVWQQDSDGNVNPLGLVVGIIVKSLFYIVYPLVFIEKALEMKNKKVVWNL